MRQRKGRLSSNANRKRPSKGSRVSLLFVFLALPFLLVQLSGHTLFPKTRASAGMDERAQAAIPLAPLLPGEAREREIGFAESLADSFALERGQAARLLIEPRGIELGGALYAPDGQRVLEFACRHDGLTPLSLIAETTGAYRLEVLALEGEPARGRYTVELAWTRAAAKEDEERAIAERLSAEAETLRAVRSGVEIRLAIEKYEEARGHWHSAGEGEEEARALNLIGESYFDLGQPEQALGAYQEALRLSRKLDHKFQESAALNHLSSLQLALGQPRKALELSTKARSLSLSLGDRRGEALALNNLGEVHYFSGDLAGALGFYQQALPLWRAVGDRRGEAQTLFYLGSSYTDSSETQKATEAYNQALALWRATADQRGQALTLTAIGNLYSGLGEKQKALDHYYQARGFFHEGCDQIEAARLLNGIGFVYDELGEKQQALEHYEEALRLYQAVGHRRGEATDLLNLGEIRYALGEQGPALDYCQRALAIFQELGDKRTASFALKDIGLIHDALGERAQALQFFLEALRLNRAGGDKREEAYALNNMARVSFGLGRTTQALDYYRRALPLNRAVKDRFGEASTLSNMARAERALGKLEAAREQLEAALGIIESLRTKVASQELRTSYFASIHQHYETYIDLLMQLHAQRPSERFDALAFEASERARARSLLETLSEAHADIRRGADGALLERERAVQSELDQKAARQMQILSGKHTEEEAATIASEIERVTAEYDEVKTQIRATSPHYAALTQPQPVSLRDVQQRVLDDETMLLEYSLGDARSYLWVIQKSSIESFELPKRATIESAARRLYELLVAPQPVPGETLEQFQSRVRESDAQLSPQVASLSRMVLGPIASRLGKKRLLIIPDGALQYIPFQALTVPAPALVQETPAPASGDAAAAPGEEIPLVREHEIVYESSISVLAMLRAEIERREPPQKAVAVFADPVFDSNDARLQRSPGKQVRPAAEAQSSATTQTIAANSTRAGESHTVAAAQNEAGAQAQNEAGAQAVEWQATLRDAGALDGNGKLSRLRASQDEAEAIMSLVPDSAGLKAVGFEATRAAAMNADLGRYRIVHFATHGIFNSRNPELSGVVLSLLDEQGQPQNGFLRLHEIYNLNLPVDLVVLSACNTGLGKEVRGEGLLGLTRGFMYAGAGSVVASLWRVDDQATAELMKRFYRGMLEEGLPPAAALRKAQVAMSQQRRWRSPYYWAAFVLQGEYRQNAAQRIFPRERGVNKVFAAGTAVFTLSLSGLYAVRRRRRRRRLLQT